MTSWAVRTSSTCNSRCNIALHATSPIGGVAFSFVPRNPAGGTTMLTHTRAWKAVLAAVLALAAAVAGAKPAVPSVAQLAAFPKMSSFTISPDGQHLAAVEARGEDRV